MFGFHISGLLEACCWHDEDQQERLHQLHAALYRIHLSTLPMLAEAAGLDMDAMGWWQVASLRASELGGGESMRTSTRRGLLAAAVTLGVAPSVAPSTVPGLANRLPASGCAIAAPQR